MPPKNNRNLAKASQQSGRPKPHDPALQVSVEVAGKIETDGADPSKSLLLKQYAEINRYIRSTCQLTMAWYTFFITGNLIASGWLFSEGIKEDQRSPLSPLYVGIVSGLFIVINVLSTIGFSKLIPYLQETEQQLVAILKRLNCPEIKVASLKESNKAARFKRLTAMLERLKRPVIKKEDKEAEVFSPCPHKLYIKLLGFYRLSLLAVTTFWVLLLILKLSASIQAPAN